jgi:hypothetical protein
MSSCLTSAVPIGLCLFLLAPDARAGSLSVWCDTTTPLVVVGPNDTDQTAPWRKSEFGKQMTEGGGLARLAYKGYAISNNIERADTLKWLKGLDPRLATPELATIVEDAVRSRAFKSVAVGIGIVGGYFVIDGLFGSHTPTPDETKRKLENDTTSLGLGQLNLQPCANRRWFTPGYDPITNPVTPAVPAPTRPPDRDLYGFSGDKPAVPRESKWPQGFRPYGEPDPDTDR